MEVASQIWGFSIHDDFCNVIFRVLCSHAQFVGTFLCVG
jgi:hypothetical protein